MHLYNTSTGIFLATGENYYLIDRDWDELVNRDHLHDYLQHYSGRWETTDEGTFKQAIKDGILPPIGTQEVWAAGVTYLRSRNARMEESQDSGGADCYQRVYEAERPELFFKSTPQRVIGTNDYVNIRKDSSWNVPEPELTLFINSHGSIQGYTIGNDVSSRSIEGENPLYLPQAKVYERSAALGPALYIPPSMMSVETVITMQITRAGNRMYSDFTPISRMKRGLQELAGYLYRGLDFPTGAYLMTGTCLVPGADFTLQAGDVVDIDIDHIGRLTNTIAVR